MVGLCVLMLARELSSVSGVCVCVCVFGCIPREMETRREDTIR